MNEPLLPHKVTVKQVRRSLSVCQLYKHTVYPTLQQKH